MTPQTYCQRALQQARQKSKSAPTARESRQIEIVLGYFIHQELTEGDFMQALQQLIASSKRDHRPGLAVAASAVLADWQAQSPATESSGPLIQ